MLLSWQQTSKAIQQNAPLTSEGSPSHSTLKRDTGFKEFIKGIESLPLSQHRYEAAVGHSAHPIFPFPF